MQTQYIQLLHLRIGWSNLHELENRITSLFPCLLPSVHDMLGIQNDVVHTPTFSQITRKNNDIPQNQWQNRTETWLPTYHYDHLMQRYLQITVEPKIPKRILPSNKHLTLFNIKVYNKCPFCASYYFYWCVTAQENL